MAKRRKWGNYIHTLPQMSETLSYLLKHYLILCKCLSKIEDKESGMGNFTIYGRSPGR